MLAGEFRASGASHGTDSGHARRHGILDNSFAGLRSKFELFMVALFKTRSERPSASCIFEFRGTNGMRFHSKTLCRFDAVKPSPAAVGQPRRKQISSNALKFRRWLECKHQKQCEAPQAERRTLRTRERLLASSHAADVVRRVCALEAKNHSVSRRYHP